MMSEPSSVVMTPLWPPTWEERGTGEEDEEVVVDRTSIVGDGVLLPALHHSI